MKLIGKKMGMTQMFNEVGNVIPVTVVKMEPNIVIRQKSKEKDGYDACVVGAGERSKPNRPYSGIFKSSGVKPTNNLYEIRDYPADWKQGKQVTIGIFEVGGNLNVTGVVKGRGFAGVIKRYHFSGGPGGHGSKFHRHPGSIGCCKTPGKVYKGRKMPGRMGGNTVTVKNLKVVKIDESRELLFIKGAIPGAKNSTVIIRG